MIEVAALMNLRKAIIRQKQRLHDCDLAVKKNRHTNTKLFGEAYVRNLPKD